MKRISTLFGCGNPAYGAVDAPGAPAAPDAGGRARPGARTPVAVPAGIDGFPLSANELAEAMRLQTQHDSRQPRNRATASNGVVITPESAIGFPLGDNAFAEAMQLQVQFDSRQSAVAGTAQTARTAAPSRPVPGMNTTVARDPARRRDAPAKVHCTPMTNAHTIRAIAGKTPPSTRVRGIAGWTAEATGRATGKAADAKAFRTFLDRLQGNNDTMAPAEFTNWTFRPAFVFRVDALLDAMETSPTLRATCLMIAADATDSCGDRIGLALNDMEVARINDDAIQGRYSDAALFTLGRGLYRLDLLEGVVTDALTNRETTGRKTDPVEIRLAYQTQLASRLDLPGVSHAMLHLSEAHLKPHDLDNAAATVLRTEAATGGINFLAQWHPWQEAMKRRNPQSFALVERSIEAQQEAFAVLPDSLPSQVQRSLYDELANRKKAEIENFTKTETVKFLSENESLLQG